jgi:hypothetical protein
VAPLAPAQLRLREVYLDTTKGVQSYYPIDAPMKIVVAIALRPLVGSVIVSRCEINNRFRLFVCLFVYCEVMRKLELERWGTRLI